jgi:hypothetical protein
MNRKELEERVDEILLKRTRGEQLTRQERRPGLHVPCGGPAKDKHLAEILKQR